MPTPCPRCHGLLLPVERDQTDEGYWTGARCLNCGSRMDSMILAHRLHRPEPSYALRPARRLPME